MIPVKVYPARVVAVNGSATGPFLPAPSSTFKYDLEVTMDDGVRLLRGVVPAGHRWSDSVKMWPFIPEDVVFVHRVGTSLVMKDAEAEPFVEACP